MNIEDTVIIIPALLVILCLIIWYRFSHSAPKPPGVCEKCGEKLFTPIYKTIDNDIKSISMWSFTKIPPGLPRGFKCNKCGKHYGVEKDEDE